jgi:hypothetical protein
MLDDTNLAKGTFTDYSVKVEVIEGDLGGEVDILRRCTTHGWEARRGGLRAFDRKRRGIRRMKWEGTIMLDKATRGNGETLQKPHGSRQTITNNISA